VAKKSVEIPGYQGRAIIIERDNVFRVVDVEGCQIADMFVMSEEDPREYFSPAMTRQVISRLIPKPGDFLYSNRRNPMLAFIKDISDGPHDMAFAPCDPGFYVDLGGDQSHPNCRDNFYEAMREINVHIEPPPDPFNLFQNTVPKMDGDYEVGQTLTKAGDYVEFKTKMNVIVVVTACSVDLPIEGIEPIGGTSTPVRIEVD
jgi:uncharacterized protein YcgI (DUF1989 family)